MGFSLHRLQYGPLHGVQRSRDFAGLDVTLADGGIGVFQAIAGERADDAAPFGNLAGLNIAQYPCNRRGGGGFAEDTFLFRQQGLGGEDFLIGTLIEPAAGFLLRCPGLSP